MNVYLLMMTFRVWFLELAVTAVNYFFLMSKVYEPRYGKLKAHQIGMSTRIVYIFVFAYFILCFANAIQYSMRWQRECSGCCSYWRSSGLGASLK